MCASNLYGWDGSFAYYLVADHIKGPYLPANEMKIMPGVQSDYAHVSQTGFFVTVQGSEQQTVIFCGDRWADFAGNGLGFNQWCPLSFDHNEPYFNSLSSWNLDAATGRWTVGRDNNYVKNGSFEADRRKIPSPVKPVQQQLLGWTSQVIEGTPIEIGHQRSPELNHFNDHQERQLVIGEKSLQITDHVPFKRKVFQVIESTPHVPLEDGQYVLKAKIKNSLGFTQLRMYITINGKSRTLPVKGANPTWKTYTLPDIPVEAGKVELGFYAEGDADAWCLVDDVSLVRSSN